MGSDFPTASPPETVLFNLVQMLPNGLQGQFSKRPRFVAVFTHLDADQLVVQLLTRMRDKYRSQAVWTRVLGDKSLVLLGVDAIREALDKSATVYASTPKAKLLGMGHFQPDAVTLSSGQDWQDRRRFNEAVLATHERIHPLASTFLAVVREEVDRMLEDLGGSRLEWDHFAELFKKISLRVIFGDSARNDHRIVEHLDAMMSEANRIIGLRKSKHFDPFYARVGEYIGGRAEPGSLVSLFKDIEQTERTRAAGQVTHWMFAMGDTLAVNTFRALAAIVALPEVEARVREELADADLTDPGAVDGLHYLRGCVEEAMRLWPTVNLFGRVTMEDTTLAGVTVPKDTQLFIPNTFHHRDAESVPDADFFVPERWSDGGPDYRFNHLSNGTQICAAYQMVLFLADAVLANLLTSETITLEQPVSASSTLGPEPSASAVTGSGKWALAHLLAGGRVTFRHLEQLALKPTRAIPHLVALFRTVPAVLLDGNREELGQATIEPGRPMPYMLNFLTLQFQVEPDR